MPNESFKLEGLSIEQKEGFLRFREIITDLNAIDIKAVPISEQMRLIEEVIFLCSQTFDSSFYTFERRNPEVIVGQTNTDKTSVDVGTISSRKIYKKGLSFPPSEELKLLLLAISGIMSRLRKDYFERNTTPNKQFIQEVIRVFEGLMDRKIPEDLRILREETLKTSAYKKVRRAVMRNTRSLDKYVTLVSPAEKPRPNKPKTKPKTSSQKGKKSGKGK
jgi:hypothetical protein